MYQLWDLYLNDCWSYSNIMYCQFQFVYKEELNNRISTSVNWDFFIGEFADSHYKSLEKRSKVKWLYCEAVKSVQFNNYLIKHDDKRYFPKYLGNCNQ
ncbi:hypothetical protein C8D97_101184 [Pleionea mediterranea]|uniref:Uncharacterized protein n=2 Tax=Pleionea mediterranea TaxID=523701 RepID=A0A316G349_9GAMM|nr:hypothetical protein C8D97_101184 [Pleionea mediterranea]